jgi:hypothetical protein
MLARGFGFFVTSTSGRNARVRFCPFLIKYHVFSSSPSLGKNARTLGLGQSSKTSGVLFTFLAVILLQFWCPGIRTLLSFVFS